eukprot:TRINITY_DN76967_c0_g1_i1.p1 TRINITY_DN76967_c0_g1~~TRINITY_DN76967_c0_g1_i1.p1  ORF type:complete len:168 (-),score=28.19 TRINITY_DN76967_c0_g1_i1:49-552(-)
MDLLVDVREANAVAETHATPWLLGGEKPSYSLTCFVRSKKRHTVETKFRTPWLKEEEQGCGVAWNHTAPMHIEKVSDTLELQLHSATVVGGQKLIGKAFLPTGAFFPKGMKADINMIGVEDCIASVTIQINVRGFWAEFCCEVYRVLCGVDLYCEPTLLDELTGGVL